MLPNVEKRHHNDFVIALEFVLTIEILMRNKNNEMLVHDEYAYFEQCVLFKCKGRARTFEENFTIINDHTHLPDPANIEKFRTAHQTIRPTRGRLTEFRLPFKVYQAVIT